MTEYEELREAIKPILRDIFWIGKNCHVITEATLDYNLDRIMQVIAERCCLKDKRELPESTCSFHHWGYYWYKTYEGDTEQVNWRPVKEIKEEVKDE